MIEKIANFECVDSLGGGSAGQVYRAIEQMEGGITRTVALKVLPALPGDDPAAKERFFEEARSIISLSNAAGRHIVQCFSCGIESETRRPWISMQLVPRTLDDVIGDEPADASIVRRLTCEVLQGLHAMHALHPPLIHNDLKPGNLLVDDAGGFLITDFGLARRLSDKLTLPAFSARYAAPEIHAQGTGSPSSDLYSLGHIAYEFALGRRLFEKQFASVFEAGTTPLRLRAWRDWHLSPSHRVPPVAELIPGFDPPLSDLIARLMTKPASERPRSAADALASMGMAVPVINAATTPVDADKPVFETAKPRHGVQEEPAKPTERAQDNKQNAGTSQAPRQTVPKPIRPSAGTHTVDEKKRKTNLLLGIFAGMCAAAVIFVLLFGASDPPVIRLKEGPEFVNALGKFAIDGMVEAMPADGMVELIIEGRSPLQVKTDDLGRFKVAPALAQPGSVKGTLRVTRQGAVQAAREVLLRRDPPREVLVRFATNPAVPGVKLALRHSTTQPAVVVDTDAGGTASASLPYGSFQLDATHPKFRHVSQGAIDTGFEAESTVAVMLERTQFEVALRLMPAGPGKGKVLDAKNTATPITFAADGLVSLDLAEGKYRCQVEVPDEEPIETPFEVTRSGENQFLIVRMRGEEDVGGGSVGPTKATDRWLAIDAARVGQMSDKDFETYLRENAPLETIRIRPPAPGMRQIRIEGSVLSADDLERLRDRLKPAATRVVLDVRVNPDYVASELARRLREAGADNAAVTKVRVSSNSKPADSARGESDGQGDVQWRLKIDYQKSPKLPHEQVREICERFTLEPANIDLRRPY